MSRVLLAPGASGSPPSMAPWIDGLQALGLEAGAVSLPRGRAERAVASYAAQLPGSGAVVIGGRSFGGRVASLLCAAAAEQPAASEIVGLVAISYPLHAPGHPDPSFARVAHWPAIGVPVLLLSGDADPFARIDLLRTAVGRLGQAELVVYPGQGHTLAAVRDDAVGRIAAFVRALET